MKSATPDVAPTATLLVVDDEPNIAYSIEQCLESPNVRVRAATTGKAGVEAVRTERPQAVLLDVRLPDISGLDVFEQIHAIDPRLPVVIMTAYTTTETAIEAIRRGALDYLLKPVDVRKLNEVIHQALEASRLTHVPAVMATETSERDGSPADQIVGRSPAMQDVYKLIGRLAPQDVPILILGESGSGKELVARAIYHYSQRNQKTFMAINCAALSESLLESELFGHERGAFTGADQRRIGKFEQASGGTIFLDEIGDMTPATQAKALRLLQQQSFERLGGNVTIQTDVRIIAATNQNLSALVEQGRFRLDLFYRLNGFTIEIPPLRERIEDVAPLAEHFLRIYNRKFRRGVCGFTSEAMHCLEAHDWPGNIRELESAVEFAVIKTGGERVGVHDLPEACRPSETDTTPSAVVAESLQLKELVERLLAEGSRDIYRSVNEAVDREVLQCVMQHCAGNQHRAAELLGVSRMTLRAKLRALGLLTKKSRTE